MEKSLQMNKKYTAICIITTLIFLINLIAQNIYKDNIIFMYWLQLIFPFINHTFKDVNGIHKSSDHLGFLVESKKKRKGKKNRKYEN